ncbi:DNA repair protein [Delitschia confertaspora ATCC 74209]|uniref:DNA repair protein REV1 n=1 Tax=Delitschia confertaspora ATCC 74209 TaxID=1513339 RepID=A0A9P4JRK2_9PLEO|nr:DNA repair protein [Delitschia confertaspora ATCC 74209]
MGSRLEANSDAARKRIASHTFEDEDGEEYGGSNFGGFTDYFRRKKVKLQNRDADLRSQSTDKPPIFKGVVAHVNGYTQPSLQDLRTLIVSHGGGFMQYLDGKTAVTHIIASSLTPKKAVEFRRYRIVKPAWVVESINAGKLLPWNDFRVVDEGEKQRVLGFNNGSLVSQANSHSKGYRDQTDKSWYTSQLMGNQSESPAPTPPSSALRFSKPRLPSPVDKIEDLPPSHQPETGSDGPNNSPLKLLHESVPSKSTLVTPPKSSPPFPSQKQPEKDAVGHRDDKVFSVYTDPTKLDNIEADTTSAGHKSSKNAPESLSEKKLTAEEHNAILLSDPKIRKSTVVDPNFLDQYYRESRLHHLSTWKADLKAQLQVLANEKSSSQKVKQKRAPGARRYILHVDFDSFFAAVSLKKNPQWKDKPAVVAHGNGSGSEIASCNYPARQFGVKNGMWMKKAQELCPGLKILPYDFPAYEEASRAFYDAILSTDGIVQSVSIDEALIDVSAVCAAAGGSDGHNMSEGSIYREQAKADEIAQSLREKVKEKTDCNVSVGIGGNILLAKVALRKAKPAGQYQIKPEEVLDFIGKLQVQDLPGVAWSIGGKLEEFGITFVKDIRELSKERLSHVLGPKTGEKLWEYARGIDRTEVGEQVVRKSVSAEVDEFFGSLCGELTKRLLKEKVKGKQLTLKIMRRSSDAPLDPPKHLGHGKCDTFNKSIVLGVATNAKEVLTKEALSMLKGLGFSPGELRGIGIQMTKLEPLKSATDGQAESSQRRLQFKVKASEPPSARKPQAAEVDPIQDDPETPRKPKAQEPDQISFGAENLNRTTPSRKPLNTLGTQFLLPTQADPAILAELPESIRSKLLRQRASSPTPIGRTTTARPESKLYKPERIPLTALPAPSQLDPETLNALPEDVRAEVLAQYAAGTTPASPHRKRDQTILPQSPRKNRIIGIPFKKPVAAPVKRGRGRPPKSAMLAAAVNPTLKDKNGATLTQANFISLKNPSRSRQGSCGPSNPISNDMSTITPDDTVKDLDPEFLSALPEDIRHEVIEEHKRQRRASIKLAVFKKQKAAAAAAPPQQPKRPNTLKIPRPMKPTFTAQRLHAAPDLRKAIKEWFNEFLEDGPYDEDVGALVGYLKKVVLEERDLEKAVGVVRWMVWVVEEGEGAVEQQAWGRAVARVKESVQESVRKRGLGEVDFN